jgi:hypothetical protein
METHGISRKDLFSYLSLKRDKIAQDYLEKEVTFTVQWINRHESIIKQIDAEIHEYKKVSLFYTAN